VTRFAVAVVAMLALLAGCTSASGGSDGEPQFPNNPDHAHLVAAARLEPCPSSSASGSSGGLPDVTLPCLGKGPAVHMSGLRGTPTLINLWGSWCGPCQKETPYLQQAHLRLGKSVRFLGVDTEDQADSALDFAAHVRPPMRYPSVLDDNKAVLLSVHGPSAVPMTLFVDASGRVVFTKFKPYSSVGAVLADVAKYLGVRV
jgi:thiol-disulfide isomerase/thioredoxin